MALSESERLEALRRSLRPPVDDLSLAARPPPNNLTAQKTSLGDAGQSNTGTAMDRTLLEAAILSSASARQSLLPQSLGLAAAAAAPGAMAGPQLGMGAVPNQFLLSVAAASAGNRNLLDQARAALLSQHLSQQRERLRLQESYQALLQGKLATGGGTTIASLLQNNAPSALAIPPQLVSQAPPSYPSAASMPSSHVAQPSSIVSKTAATRKALETLGSTLRQSSDPYIDVSSVEDPDADEVKIKRTRGGVTEMFPEILHRALRQLEEEGNSDIASFHSHGRAFAVHDIDRFVAEVMPRFFKQTKWNSFARQLSLYNFVRITAGPDQGAYYHELFLKGRPKLVYYMRRVGVPTGKDRRKFKTQNATVEPDFYSMKKISTLPSDETTG